MTKIKQVKWTSPGRAEEADIDVSSRGVKPYNLFSPFSFNSDYKIPVPGNERTTAQSVEGIWQGLKFIKGKIDPTLFVGEPSKRKGRVEGHLFGIGETLGYVEARKRIYVPAYVYYTVNIAIPTVQLDLVEKLKQGAAFYDIDTNPDINNPAGPLSHAAVLVNLLNVMIDAPLPPFNEQNFSNLAEQVEALADYRNSLDESEIGIFDDIISFAYLFSEDRLSQTCALRTIKATGIDSDHKVRERIKKYAPNETTIDPYLELRL